MSDFTDLVAVVTGGASGLGLAAARLLAARGAKVACLDVAPGSLPEPLVGIACDVTDDDAVERAIEEVVERFGRLDVLVNNAGIGAVGTVADNPSKEWLHVLDVNVVGMARVSRAALPHLPPTRPGWPACSPPPTTRRRNARRSTPGSRWAGWSAPTRSRTPSPSWRPPCRRRRPAPHSPWTAACRASACAQSSSSGLATDIGRSTRADRADGAGASTDACAVPLISAVAPAMRPFAPILIARESSSAVGAGRRGWVDRRRWCCRLRS